MISDLSAALNASLMNRNKIALRNRIKKSFTQSVGDLITNEHQYNCFYDPKNKDLYINIQNQIVEIKVMIDLQCVVGEEKKN